MGKAIITAMLSIILMANIAFADSLKDEKAIRVFTDGVMEKVAKGDIKNAFNAMKPYINLSPTEVDSVAIQSKAQREQFGQRYGATIGGK